MILTGIPFFTYVVYPLVNKVFDFTPLRKIGVGFIFTAGAFSISAMIETWADARAPEVSAAMWAAMGTGGQMTA